MRRVAAAACALFVLAAAPTANAQLATKFYNLVDVPATITYSASGTAQINLDPAVGGTIPLAGYRKICLRIGTAKATGFRINMGKISNATLSQMFSGTITQQIRTFDVVGPEMVLILTGGPANQSDTVQVWVFLTA